MRSEDAEAVMSVLTAGRSTGLNAKRIILFSGSSEEQAIVSSLWPQANVHVLSESDWNLDGGHPGAWMDFDLAVACNTFMCSRDPELWLDNIAMTCRFVLVQDLSMARRQQHRHLSPETGDVARYSISSHGVIGQTDPGYDVFDLSRAGYRIIGCRVYGIENEDVVKFAVLIDLTRKMTVDA